MSSGSHQSSFSDSKKHDEATAKAFRERRRRTTRNQSPATDAADPSPLLTGGSGSSSSTQGGSAISTTTRRGGHASTIPTSAVRPAIPEDRAADEAALLNQSQERTKETLELLRLAKQQKPTSYLASRRVPTTTTTPSGPSPVTRSTAPSQPPPVSTTRNAPMHPQQTQQTRRNAPMQQQQQQQQQQQRQPFTSAQTGSLSQQPSEAQLATLPPSFPRTGQQQHQQRTDATSSSTTTSFSHRANPVDPRVMAVTTNRSRPLVRPEEEKQTPVNQQEQEAETIVTLDDTLDQLSHHDLFCRHLTLEHPLNISMGTHVRLRMMTMNDASSLSCLHVLGVHNETGLVEACHVAAATEDRTLTFCVQEYAASSWPYHPVLSFGNFVTLQLVEDENNNGQNPQYLQAAESVTYSTLAGTSTRNVTVGPVPANRNPWHVWTVLPHLWLSSSSSSSNKKNDEPPLKIGQDAVATTRLPSCAVPVRQGTPLVLRHVQTGGLLSLSGGTLRLLTDSLTSPGNIHSHPTAQTMDRLQQSNLIYPTAQEAVWFQTSAGTPLTLPSWGFQTRMVLHGDYLKHADRHGNAAASGASGESNLTFSGQVKALVDQLLGSLVGLESNMVYVRPLKSNPQAFAIQGCDLNLSQLASSLAELSSNFVSVRAFVADQYPGYNHGRVRQAFGAAVDSFLQGFLTQISTVETLHRQQPEGLGLNQLQVLLQSSCDCLSILDQITKVADNYKGGALLNALQKMRNEWYRGDSVGQDVLERLLGEASRPYLIMLQQWLEDGTLDDPHKEFMVQSSPGASEWEDCFAVRPEHVLQGYFATSPTLDRVLPTGRYWHAIQSCQSKQKKTKTRSSFVLTYHTNPSEVASFVQKQYMEASRELSRLLLVDFDLMGTLKLIKRYYLLDQGDFFVNFMDAAENDLYVPRDKLSVGRLQHWLSLSVQLTEHKSDEAWVASSSRTPPEIKPSANEIRCRLTEYGLIDRLDRLHRETGGIDTSSPGTPQRRIYGSVEEDRQTGVDVFCIELPRIPSPLNLILSPTNMNDYQLLFRSLFFAKHVERRLVSVWRDHMALKELPSIRGSMGRTFLLRQRMLHCLQNLIYYMMFEVIEPNWTELETKIMGTSSESNDESVDYILMVHSRFLERTLEACLITSRELLSSLMRLMRTCLFFADQMKRFMTSIRIHEDRHKLALDKQKRAQHGLHSWDTLRRSNQKALQETLRQDYLDRQRRVAEQTARVEREAKLETYAAMIDRHEVVFNQHLREFMNLLSKSDDLYHTQKVNLCISLDFNGFGFADTTQD